MWIRNGAPRGEKFFVFYNPPVVNRQLGIRRSYIGETRRIALEFIERNRLQTLVFANNRLATEVLVTYLKDACERGPCPRKPCAAIAAATCRASAAKSSASCATARSAPWWPPTRSNWASTSARWTRW
jgi:ATP-dependent helicase YprA (DUF1998 family)